MQFVGAESPAVGKFFSWSSSEPSYDGAQTYLVDAFQVKMETFGENSVLEMVSFRNQVCLQKKQVAKSL
jgi:hypothetical protein